MSVSKLKSVVGGLRSRYTAACVTAGVALMMSAPAHATGWTATMNNFTAMARAAIPAVTIVLFALGLAAVGYAGLLLRDKGGERGDDIKMSRIVYTAIGGAVCMALGFIALQTVQTIGGGTGDLGRIITPN